MKKNEISKHPLPLMMRVRMRGDEINYEAMNAPHPSMHIIVITVYSSRRQEGLPTKY
jgi:hypothetical protein